MQKKAGTSRKERSVQTRNKIYESARELFSKYGFEAVNVDDIVRHADVAKGSFYVHFESKDLLIAQLINENVKKADYDYELYLQSLPADMSPHDVILSLVDKIADTITDTIGYENMRILYKIQLGKDISLKSAICYNRELYQILVKILEKGVKAGEFRSDIPIEEISRHIIMAYRGLVYEWSVRYPELNLKQQALQHFKIMLKGL